MSTTLVRRVVLIGALVAIGLPADSRAAESLEFYKLGLKAVDSGDWAQAAEMMRKAIQGRPDARARIMKTLFLRPYLPHYFLGKALQERGDCDGALAAWQESEAQGVVRRFSEYEELKRGRSECQQRLSAVEFARGEARRVIDRTASAATAARQSLVELSKAGEPIGRWSHRLAETEADFESARSRLLTDGGELAEIERAAAAVAEAGDRFESIRREAAERLSSALAQRQQESANLAAAEQEALEALSSSQFLNPYPPLVSATRKAVEDALARVPDSVAGMSLAEIRILEEDLLQATGDLKRSAAPPPPQLQHAAQAFLDGEYSRVIETLAEQRFSSSRASSHAHLLKAASFFALFHSSAAGDVELLSKARQEVFACRVADPGLLPRPTIFSPRFIAFFEGQAGEVAGPEAGGRSGAGR